MDHMRAREIRAPPISESPSGTSWKWIFAARSESCTGKSGGDR